jgi:PLP dependent protein
MPITDNILAIKSSLPSSVNLVAISKTQSAEKIMEAYQTGQRAFGENKVQELLQKQGTLPNDIQWHLVGHLQNNKVKYIAPFIHLIHSVDSVKLLEEINKQALKHNRTIPCLLQLHIAEEETKFGFDFKEVEDIFLSGKLNQFKNCLVVGLMGMATNTENKVQIRNEFKSLKTFFEKLRNKHTLLTTLSMGMSSDYKIAIEEGSTLIRVGSTVFGNRR